MADDLFTSVRSIIKAFLKGGNVLERLHEKQRRKRDYQTLSHEEHTARLSKSLRQGRHQITQEYERGRQGLGDTYARGDSIAQHSLARILLELNTGLVSIIETFLQSDRRGNGGHDYRALTSLSERSRRESVDVLRQLYQRTASRRLPAKIRNKDDLGKTRRPEHQRQERQEKQKKLRGPTIARVTIEDSSKRSQLAVIKPGTKRKSPASSSSNLSKTKSYSTSTTAVNSALSSAKSSPRLPPANVARRSTTALVAPSDAVRTRSSRPAAQSSPDMLSPYSAELAISRQIPPMPRPQLTAPRQNIPTIYSVATDSTKLGEIPLHRWAVPYDFDEQSLKNRQAMQNGWPLIDLDGNAVVKPKKRFGFLSMFKKKDALTPTAGR